MKYSHDIYKCRHCGLFFSLPRDCCHSEDILTCPLCGSDFDDWFQYGAVFFDNPKTILDIVEVYNERERAKKR